MCTRIRRNKVKFANQRNYNKWIVISDERVKLMSNTNVNLLDKNDESIIIYYATMGICNFFCLIKYS